MLEISHVTKLVIPFVPNAPFHHRKVSDVFRGYRKGGNGNEWVNVKNTPVIKYQIYHLLSFLNCCFPLRFV